MDANILSKAIREIGFPLETIRSTDEIPEGTMEEFGSLIIAQESLSEESLEKFSTRLGRQDDWSEMPVILLAGERSGAIALREAVRAQFTRARLVVLSRPLSWVEFQTAVQSSMSNRLRQYQVRDHLRMERLLRRELNHRVKNLITTVQSIARLTRRTTGTGKDSYDDFLERLDALNNVHGMLMQMDTVGVRCDELFQELLRPYMDGDKLQLHTEPVNLFPAAAHSLGLCLYELVTNAVKYGALSHPVGTVVVDFRTDGDTAWFRWKETVPFTLTQPETMGYGSRFIGASLASVFGSPANVAYEQDGLLVEGSGPRDTVICPPEDSVGPTVHFR
ncbi:sensor histidine kinase [Tropicimonas isoalkanivorans]|nr:sensor histidine kinase [Tropicimonas isoalkanivorans]